MQASAFPSYKLLAETPALHNCGATLYADNWFTGIKTMETVFSYGMDYIGTVRTDHRPHRWGVRRHQEALQVRQARLLPLPYVL